jgi:hypothetical protein
MLSMSRGRAIFGTSPAGFNDAWERAREGAPRRQRTRGSGWRSWQITAAEAGLIHPDELAEARAELDEASYAQEYDARFANLTGRVYRAFQRERTRRCGSCCCTTATCSSAWTSTSTRTRWSPRSACSTRRRTARRCTS